MILKPTQWDHMTPRPITMTCLMPILIPHFDHLELTNAIVPLKLLMDAYIHVYWLYLWYFDYLFYHMCVLYIYNGGSLWEAIYRLLIGHPSDTHD